MAREDKDSQYGGGSYNSSENISDRGQSFGGGNDRPDYTGADLGFEITRQKELSNLVNNRDFDPFERFRNQQLGDIPITGIVGLGLNALRGPLQQGMTYNRNFFLENVLPSGKMLTAEEFSNLSNSQREGLYNDYMQARLSGQTDAYGNPLTQSDGGSNPLQNILLAQQLQPGLFPQPQPGIPTPVKEKPQGVVALYEQYLKNLGYL